MPTPTEDLNSDGNLVSNEAFAEYMAPIEAALSDYAVAVNTQAVGHGYLPAPTSPAMAELNIERAWATDSWSEPVRNAQSYASTLLYTLVEHVAAFAAIIAHTRVGPSQSHRPTLRALFEITPIAHWLFDPTMGRPQGWLMFLIRGVCLSKDGHHGKAVSEGVPRRRGPGCSQGRR